MFEMVAVVSVFTRRSWSKLHEDDIEPRAEERMSWECEGSNLPGYGDWVRSQLALEVECWLHEMRVDAVNEVVVVVYSLEATSDSFTLPDPA